MADTQPQVAVLLAAYNGMRWIEEQIASILTQGQVDVRIYISVDPSNDGTEAWCARCAEMHANVELLPAAGPFGGAARNFFRLIRDVDFSAFDYVAFSDQDDIWYPDKLHRAVTTLKSGRIDGYSSNVIAFWPDGRRMLVDKAQPQVKWDYLFEAAGPGCTYVLTLKMANKFRDFVVKHWENIQGVTLHDWLCYAFARSAGFTWNIDPIPSMDYRQHTENQVGVNSGLQSAIRRVKKMTDGWWLGQVRRISNLTAGLGSQSISDRPQVTGRRAIAALGIQSRQCRRRSRDQVIFAVFCIVAAACLK
ncbi:glycosyltransferase [Pseudomonas cremoricolorata]|uniref:Glycosyl transferase n=1 Tax=Pseudomonas cremoricolorata TaxID=157783 RepID=A0A089WKX5_9PSED|nr:glycosyltransferase [Pseudomonas cremoricolorata]AIR89965.1 glycosyl transferase [Pseudomonas cremoricolorata]